MSKTITAKTRKSLTALPTIRRTIRLFLFLFLLTSFPLTSPAQITFRLDKNAPLRKLQFAETVINSLYVDTVNENQLVENAIRGMLKSLDPHSSYSTPEEAKEMHESLAGDFEGIGVQFNILNDTLVVVQTTLNGPSEKVGILPATVS